MGSGSISLSHMHVCPPPGIFQVALAVAMKYGIGGIRLAKERIVRKGDYPGLVGLWRRGTLSSLAALKARPLEAAALLPSAHVAGIAEIRHLTQEDPLRLLRSLKPGLTEIMVHAGFRDSVLDGWIMSRRYMREFELMALTSLRVKEPVTRHPIKLVTCPAVLNGRRISRNSDEYAQA